MVQDIRLKYSGLSCLAYRNRLFNKFLSNSEMDHIQACIMWSFRYNNFICFRIQPSERMTFGPGSDYPHLEKWKLSLVQYSLKYASSNANWCKGLRDFLMSALFFAPRWNNLIKNYFYTVQVTIWWKESIQDLINKILGKGPIWFFPSMNTSHFQWEDLYIGYKLLLRKRAYK